LCSLLIQQRERKMDNQIITLSIRNDFYTPMVFYHLKGCLYPPFLKEAYNNYNVKSQSEKELVKRTTELMFSRTTGGKKYKLEWFVLTDDTGKPVGFWGASFLSGKNSGKCLLEYLLVDESERRKGYATKLVENFLEWTQRVGRTNIKLDFNNVDYLKKFYSKFGFTLREGDTESDEGIITWYKTPDDYQL
jgi:GNAT superfamily N-acetyltransferase